MVMKVVNRMLFCVLLLGVLILYGPQELTAETSQITGGCDDDPCVSEADCFPGCAGPDAQYGSCPRWGDPPSDCSVDRFSYPCGRGLDCEQLHSASGDPC